MAHASHWAIVNPASYPTRIAATSRRGKILIFEKKLLAFILQKFLI